MTELDPWAFIAESNKIEGIIRAPDLAEVGAFGRFVELPQITLPELNGLTRTFQPDARLRDQPGMNVRVGTHVAPQGGPEIVTALESLLGSINARQDYGPYRAHRLYETLHPFTDGNGRSGRAIWAWQMMRDDDPMIGLGFLHAFYYQALQASR